MASIYVSLASCSAAFAGAFGAQIVLATQKHRRRLKSIRQDWRGKGAREEGRQGIAQSILAGLEWFDSQNPFEHYFARFARVLPLQSASLKKQLSLAGMGEMRLESVFQYRVLLATFGCGAGLLLGLGLSIAAALVLSVGFAFLGWLCVPLALKARIAQRTRMVERHISEAIEVICLGLRAGLSFERSLNLYATYFPTPLSREFLAAQQTWNTGLVSRGNALQELAEKYDSTIFERVIQSMVRSLKFGSPLADSLEELAIEARKSHRTKVEEMVMKAPVKMMLPIGLLILPSMLLLVMGPIMLELVDGF